MLHGLTNAGNTVSFSVYDSIVTRILPSSRSLIEPRLRMRWPSTILGACQTDGQTTIGPGHGSAHALYARSRKGVAQNAPVAVILKTASITRIWVAGRYLIFYTSTVQ